MSKKKKHNSDFPTVENEQTPQTPNFEDVSEAQAPEAAPEKAAPELTPEEKLTAEVAAAKKELEDQQAKYLYLQADYQNYRRRMVKEISDARMIGVISTVDPFLRVFDYLSMARAAAEKSDNIESLKQGVSMIIGEYVKAFDDLGVKKEESVGKKFNPDWQEAVAQEHSDDVAEGIVLKEWSAAYRMGERLLRPAKVVVSAGPQKDEPQGEKTETAE